MPRRGKAPHHNCWMFAIRKSFGFQVTVLMWYPLPPVPPPGNRTMKSRSLCEHTDHLVKSTACIFTIGQSMAGDGSTPSPEEPLAPVDERISEYKHEKRRQHEKNCPEGCNGGWDA